MALISLKEILFKNAARFQSRNEAALLLIKDVWPRVSRELALGKSAQPASFKKGVLVISCSSLAEASSLRLEKERIKKQINSSLKEKLIKDIRFKTIS